MLEVKVPDIGDFKDVEVIEVLVKPGDRVAKEQSLISLESDKATMEIPSPAAGVVKSLVVKLGDKVSEGAPILVLEEAAEVPSAAPPKPAAPAPQPAAAPVVAPQPGTFGGGADYTCEVVVLGSGPGGYSTAFRAADLGLNTVLVERYATLGGVCLNVGCIPSKALLHVAAVMDEAVHFADIGVVFGKPSVDLDKLRAHKDKVVGKLVGGVGSMAKGRKVTVVRGYGHFLDPHHLEVELTSGNGQDKTGEKKVVRFEKAIIAAGSAAVRLPFIPDDPRIVDSTGALELASVPKRMLVVGGGIIGLEMASVYSTLGARIDVVEMLDGLMTGADRDLVAVLQRRVEAICERVLLSTKVAAVTAEADGLRVTLEAPDGTRRDERFDKVMLKTKTVAVEARKEGVLVKFEGEQAPAEPQLYDLVLVSVGRSPNGKKIGAEQAGVAVNERGFIPVDRQMRTNVAHIFAIGDIAGPPMLAHKAVHEGHVAAEAAAGKKSFFDARVIPSVAYTDPEVAWVGVTEDEAKSQGVKYGVAKFPWSASGRALANGRSEGFTKLIFDAEHHRVIGGGIVGTGAGDLITEIALAIEMGADAVDIGKTIHPHPTLSESVGMAAEVYEGVCTDLPPPRKR